MTCRRNKTHRWRNARSSSRRNLCVTMSCNVHSYCVLNLVYLCRCYHFRPVKSWARDSIYVSIDSSNVYCHLLNQPNVNIWELCNFDDTSRYGLRTKLFLLPFAGTCSLLYSLSSVLHSILRCLLTQAPNSIILFIQKLYLNPWIKCWELKRKNISPPYYIIYIYKG